LDDKSPKITLKN